VPKWYYHLQQLTQRGLLVLSVRSENESLATLAAIAPSFVFPYGMTIADGPHVLSRFAYSHIDEGALLLESPLSKARVILSHGCAAGLLYGLAHPCWVAELPHRVHGLSFEAAVDLIGLLTAAGIVSEVHEGVSLEDRMPALLSWSFHDLLFHTRSREGRHDKPLGATYPMAGLLPPPPALKTSPGEGIPLFRPNLEELKRLGPSFAQVQDERCSIREYATEPISDHQLGEFLYRVARMNDFEKCEVATPAGVVEVEFASRPYPAGGGLYELEFYLFVNACENLAPGLYHYDPRRHSLHPLAEKTAGVELLLRDAGTATGISPAALQVLVVLAARFERVAWKYSMLAYSLILKHVGVVLQTMYLTATAMGLAPCAIGAGNSDLFARVAGTDYYAETSVGEFLLGSRRAR
jgi:SagB-type dehydrogenase family enzyme